MNKIVKIRKLIEQLNNASNAYYNLSEPIMTDKEWDKYFDELKILEKETNVILTDSPTQRAGYTVASSLPKLQHDIPLLSLNKIKTISDAKKWLENHHGILMLKIDGGTGKIQYEIGKFIGLSTRGDSTTNTGEIISHNVNCIRGIPLTIEDKNSIQIIGENYITYDDFKKINNSLPANTKPFTHPRNLANGSVGLLDSKICKKRNVRFAAFNIVKGNKHKTKKEQLEWLIGQGFEVPTYWEVDKDNIEEVINNIIKKLPTLEIPIDGLVISLNDIEYGLSLGATAHHYNHSIAFKFKDEWYETKYSHTEWNTSRTRKIIPTGVFKSVLIDGAEVTRASLHNIDIFNKMQLGKDDVIEVSKRNMIIPCIENNLTRTNTEKIPTQCSTCGSKTEIRQIDDSKTLYCTNPNCSAQLVKTIQHYCSRDAMNVEGFSEAKIEKFVEKGFLRSIYDIYFLDGYENQIKFMDGFGDKSYDNLIRSIEASKKDVNMSNFLYALGIEQVGKNTAKTLCSYFSNNLNAIASASKNELSQIEDIGDVTAKAIYDYFQNNDEMVFDLLIPNIKFKEENKMENTSNNKSNNFITGKTFVVTGSVNHFKNRNELQAKIEELGGKVTGSVSKNTDYLINNDSTSGSSKNKKAKELGVSIITEDEFLTEVNKSI